MKVSVYLHSIFDLRFHRPKDHETSPLDFIWDILNEQLDLHPMILTQKNWGRWQEKRCQLPALRSAASCKLPSLDRNNATYEESMKCQWCALWTFRTVGLPAPCGTFGTNRFLGAEKCAECYTNPQISKVFGAGSLSSLSLGFTNIFDFEVKTHFFFPSTMEVIGTTRRSSTPRSNPNNVYTVAVRVPDWILLESKKNKAKGPFKQIGRSNLIHIRRFCTFSPWWHHSPSTAILWRCHSKPGRVTCQSGGDILIWLFLWSETKDQEKGNCGFLDSFFHQNSKHSKHILKNLTLSPKLSNFWWISTCQAPSRQSPPGHACQQWLDLGFAWSQAAKRCEAWGAFMDWGLHQLSANPGKPSLGKLRWLSQLKKSAILGSLRNKTHEESWPLKGEEHLRESSFSKPKGQVMCQETKTPTSSRSHHAWRYVASRPSTRGPIKFSQWKFHQDSKSTPS